MLVATTPGYFLLSGNERALARLLWRAESDSAFYAQLKRQCASAARLTRPAREQKTPARRLPAREVAA